ncbi:MAG: hypothetical protein NTY19_40020 [Planctomycetota bacterium]|nr:hypothetical protein [Planctomycetota bacterium]
MNVRRVCRWCLVTALVTLGSGLGLDQVCAAQPDQPPPPPVAEEGVQVLTRGPVHEAFAETVSFDPEPGIVVPQGPPAAIDELPPEQRLEGANVAWIPGYWAWDDERSDFLWVSGIWRNLPPGRQWVPGYWGQSGTAFQWTSGYWADARANRIEYLSEPPETVEAGPNRPAPSADQTWLPGCWIWRDARYVWRPGFWAPVQPDWVWVPSYYVWAPRGYVYVTGYWDYSVVRRGVLFAPVYFNAAVYSRRGFSYSPATVIDLDLFTEHLFLRPQYNHYYFGDYYAANYSTAGIYPWHSFQNQHGYDPIYAHQRWEHRQDGQWEHRLAADFGRRRDHEEARPPRTWAAQGALTARGVNSTVQSLVVARSLDQLAKSKQGTLRFQPASQDERHKLAQHGQDVQRFRETRQRLENHAATTPAAKPAPESGPARVKLPKSPIRAQSPAQMGQDVAPPKAHKVPRPDPGVEPKSRVNRPTPQSQPHVDRPAPQTQPHVNQPAPQPQRKVDRPTPQPHVDRPAPQSQTHVNQPAPQPQRKVDRPTPQAQPHVDRPAPQQPRKVDRPAPQPRDNRPAGPPAAGPQHEQHKGKNKG